MSWIFFPSGFFVVERNAYGSQNKIHNLLKCELSEKIENGPFYSEVTFLEKHCAGSLLFRPAHFLMSLCADLR